MNIVTAEHPVSINKSLLVVILLIALGLILIARAWVGDDVFITMRVVDNFVHGFGPNYNINERVQAYTHPFWMFLLTSIYSFWRDPYAVPLVLSLLVSISACIFAAFKVARTPTGAALGLFLLSLSSAFIDFSSSGLENPLSHLLLALFVWFYLFHSSSQRFLFWLSLFTALSAFNRLDTILLFLPPLSLVFFQQRSRKALLQLLAGMLPLFLWEAFSLFYYGFPFPNTFYAKINPFIPPFELIKQGLLYLLYTLENDPLSLFIILAGLFLPFLLRFRQLFPFALGILLYLVYTISIGGDFMAGRFLTTPIFLAALIIMSFDFSLIPISFPIGFALIALLLGINTSYPTYQFKIDLNDPNRKLIQNGIANERAWYINLSLLNSSRTSSQPLYPTVQIGLKDAQSTDKVITTFAIGIQGFYAGYTKHIIDLWALTEPLLAHIPPVINPNWRPGHMLRVIPEGYMETLRSGTNQITDPGLARYYNALHLITSGNLFNLHRFSAILRMNLGLYNSLISVDKYYFGNELVKSLADVSTPIPENTPTDASGIITLPSAGLRLDLPLPQSPRTINLNLDWECAYTLAYYLQGKLLFEQTIEELPDPQGMQTRLISVPPQVQNTGFDRLRILPSNGLKYLFGYLNWTD